MPMRSSSLANNPLAITRELDGRYDVVLQVRDNLDLIEQVAGIDFATILAELESAQDFTGITVLQGETVAWDAVNKILTVPKGDKGDKGDTGLTGPQGTQGIQGIQGIKGNTGPKGDTGSQGPKGFDGAAGAQGSKGDTGNDLTISQITYNGNGTFNWLFSDGTVYVTPSLKGPKGDTGNQGVKGDQGISVHHIKGTSTTDDEGDFGAYGEIDTYTVYGDANETINLGFFRVNNGAAKEGQYGLMYKSTYDITANGIVDNSEKLEGRTIAQIQADITDTIGASNGIASLDATTKLERAQVPTMNVTLEGDVSGNFAVDGSLNTTVNVVVQDNSHSHTFSNLTANPTTLSGYGITDADTSAQVSAKISTAVAALVDSSPATLDTLNELAAALGDDPNFATTTATAIGTKVTKNADITAGTATKVTYDAKGLVTNGTTLSAGDIPVLDAGKITTGTLPVLRGGTGTTTSTGTGSVVLSSSPVLVTPTIGVATGTSFNSITELSNTAALAAGIAAIGTSTLVARQDHVHPVQTTISGNAGTATTLATARTIGMTGDVTWTSASFNGSGDVTGTATLATITNSGSGSFKKITANSKGLVTGTVSVTQADITGLLGAGSISNTMLANGAVATLSGTNTGDETLATIKTKLGITTLSGSNTGDQTITLTGDVTGTGTGSFVTTLKNTGTTGTYRSVTTDAQGRVTAGTNPTTLSGYGITDAYTKAELNAGQLDNRYYTETEINAALALKVDDTEIASVNLLRADKYLAAQNIANMSYTDGNLTKIQYNDALDIDYEVFAYTSGNLSNIQHYVGSVLKGTTTLSYTSGNLVSAIFVGV